MGCRASDSSFAWSGQPGQDAFGGEVHGVHHAQGTLPGRGDIRLHGLAQALGAGGRVADDRQLAVPGRLPERGQGLLAASSSWPAAMPLDDQGVPQHSDVDAVRDQEA